ncbi:MAG: DEAD/DEAH box helicase [Spirochaetaceae bacterium]|nr:MAG: DEAD/DEAH box helicase [Spirochaetaceae bacterium]
MQIGKKHGRLGPEITQYLNEAGFSKPTLLQETVIPAVLEGRDISVESGNQRGKTLSMVIPLVMKLKPEHLGIQALILTTKPEQAQKSVKYLKKLLKEKKNPEDAVVIGFTDLIKKEAHQLENAPAIVVSTPNRFIDHIRRGPVDLSMIDYIFIDEEENRTEEFENDIFFIFSKISRQFQTVRFSYPDQQNGDRISQLLKRPLFIQKKDFAATQNETVFSVCKGTDKTEMLSGLLYCLGAEAPIILVRGIEESINVVKDLKGFKLQGYAIDAKTPNDKKSRYFSLLRTQSVDYIVCEVGGFADIRGENFSHVFIYSVSENEHLYEIVRNPEITGYELKEVITLITENEAVLLAEIAQRGKIAMQNREQPRDIEMFKAAAKRLIQGMHEHLDQEEFKKIVTAVKKAVPFGQRTLFASYLFQQAMGKAPVAQAGARKPGFTTLFVNAGRSRDVSGSELKAFFCDNLRIEHSMIKDVRVFDNYSFVEIDSNTAERAIEVLHDKDFKGRPLVVNFSRKKPERKSFGPRRKR